MSCALKKMTETTVYGVTLSDVEEAAVNIDGIAHVTPVLTCSTLDKLSGRVLHFKCENFQKIGAFKIRGATNAIRKLCKRVKDPIIVTHSSGNHAQAVAFAAKAFGVQAKIIMPRTAPKVKKAAVEGYGATIIECEPDAASRERMADSVLAECGSSGFLIPPYDHVDVIAGQGTVAREFLNQVPELDAIVVPVGGGGLLSGICVAAKAIKPDIKIYAAEPAAADDCYRSFTTKTFVPLEGAPSTIADGLKTSLGKLTWPIIRDKVDAVFTVTEEEIVQAMRTVYERMKVVIEPSAAVGVAVVLSKRFKTVAAERVGIILCGGNVDLDHLPWTA